MFIVQATLVSREMGLGFIFMTPFWLYQEVKSQLTKGFEGRESFLVTPMPC